MDILGPSNVTNAVTVRPADGRIPGPDDTFFRDCSSPAAQDGTQIPAGFLNTIAQQLRRAIDGMGITRNPADDDMLLKAIRAASTAQVFEAAATQPTHLEILETSGRFTIAASSGSIVINPAQRFVWRGLVPFSTDQFDASARTFATSPSLAYHLRWHAPGTGEATPKSSYPNGRFVLKRLTDAVYNPAPLSADVPALDGTYDSALLARIVTDGANNPTVTPLTNRAILSASVSKTTVEWNSSFSGPNAGTFNGLPRLSATLNWARSPRIWSPSRFDSAYPSSGEKSIVSFTDFGDGTGATTDLFAAPNRYIAQAVVFGYDSIPDYNYKSGALKMNAFA